MTELQGSDWIRTVGSALAGALVGAFVGFVGTCFVSDLIGDPAGHDNLLALYTFTCLGFFGGLVVGPVLAWRRWAPKNRPLC